MRYAIPELAGIAFFVIAGWVALWPARRTLGATRYHLAALPTGLLASSLAVAFSSLANRPLDLLSATVGAAMLAVILHVILRWLAPNDPAPYRVGPASFAVASGLVAALGTAFGLLRITVINYDSVMSYWPLGVELSRTGAITVHMVATRGVLLTAMNAIFHSFGSGWAYVIYPMLAVTVLGWLVSTLVDGPLAALKRSTAWTVVAVACAALVLEPSFLFHSTFVHSHMISALYLLASLTCLWMALPPTAPENAPVRHAYLVLAAVFAAGLGLARPDGLAYQFVPTVCAVGLLSMRRVDLRAAAAYFVTLGAVLAAALVPVYLELGMWPSSKASGKKMLAMLAVCAVAAAGPWVVRWLDAKLPFRVAGERFGAVFLSASVIGMAGIFVLKWHSSAGEALANAWLNLLAGHGGYSYLWWAVLVLMALTLFTGDALRLKSWTRGPFLSILLFLVVAGVVHGVGHAGRIGYGDSLNRVTFHVLPLVVWFVAASVGRILGASTQAD